MAKQLSSFQPQLKSLLDGLVGYWKLDESSGNASDSSGNGYTLTNTGTATYATGKINNGIDFTSTNTTKKLSIASGLGVSSSDYTVSWWYKNDGTDREFDGMIEFGSGSNRITALRNGTNNRWWVLADGGGNAISTETVSASTWYHLVLTRVGGTATLYVNTVSKITLGSLGSSTTQVFNIGRSDTNTWYGTNLVDEVGVWNRALSDIEIKALYNSGNAMAHPLGSTPNSTKLYMPLNGNSVDISGNGNHGTDTSISYVQGKFGQGARFGASGQIVFSNIVTPSTISFWYSVDTPTASKAAFSQAGNNVFGTQGSPVAWYAYDTTTRNFATTVKPKVWTNIVLVHNGSAYLLYENGVYKETVTSGAMSIDTISRAVDTWNGLLDEFIVENRAWTAQEISLYYRKSMLNYRAKSASLFSNFISYLLTADIRTYTLTGVSNILNRGIKMLADVQTYTLTGIANILRLGKGLVADVASFALTGYDTNFTKALTMLADVRTYALTGISATLVYIKQIIGELGQFVLTGYSAILRFKGWTKTPKDRGGIWTKTPKN